LVEIRWVPSLLEVRATLDGEIKMVRYDKQIDHPPARTSSRRMMKKSRLFFNR
jgi:hypothetical protein